MTRCELVLRTLVKVTGQPRAHLETLITKFRDQFPAKRWDDEVPPAEQAALEIEFEKSAPGILAWYVKQLQQDPELREDRIQVSQQENAKKNRRLRR